VKVQDIHDHVTRHVAFLQKLKFLRTMDEHAGGSMADGEFAGMSYSVVEEAYVEHSPMDQQKALQYEEALRNKVQ
jgi:hypothetical protein